MGKLSINILIINAVVPLLYNHAKKLNKGELREKALSWLKQLPAEKNNIIKKWDQLQMPLNSAYDSQGLLQLKNLHCSSKNCLNCAIGNTILKNDK